MNRVRGGNLVSITLRVCCGIQDELRTCQTSTKSADISAQTAFEKLTDVGNSCSGRQDSCAKISDNSLEGFSDNALESASELRLFQPNTGLDTCIRPEICPKIPSSRSQEKF